MYNFLQSLQVFQAVETALAYGLDLVFRQIKPPEIRQIHKCIRLNDVDDILAQVPVINSAVIALPAGNQKSAHREHRTALQLYKLHADFIDVHILDFFQAVAALETQPLGLSTDRLARAMLRTHDRAGPRWKKQNGKQKTGPHGWRESGR